MPAITGPMSVPRMHSHVPAPGMHALNAPMRPGSNIVGGRVVQREKRVTIHGANMARLRRSYLAD